MIDKYCPAQGNKCNKCVDLANAAFMGTYGASHPDLNPQEIRSMAETSGVQALVEEQWPTDSLDLVQCSNRQALARKIGADLGRKKA